MGNYKEIYQQATKDKAAYWLDAAAQIDWIVPPKTGLDTSNPPLAGMIATVVTMLQKLLINSLKNSPL